MTVVSGRTGVVVHNVILFLLLINLGIGLDVNKKVGVLVDTNDMKIGFYGCNNNTGLVFDLTEAFPIQDHPLIYRDRVVVLSPALSMEAEGDRCILRYDLPIPE